MAASGPSGGEALKEEGNALYKAGDYARAAGKYTEALAALGSAADTAEVRAKCRLNLAQCYLRLCSYGAAEEQCDLVLAADASSSKALLRRGQARIGRDALEDALSDMLAACKLEPKNREMRSEYDQIKELLGAHPTLPNKLKDLHVVEEKGLRALHAGRADEARAAFELMQREVGADTIPVQLPHWEARAALGLGMLHRHGGRVAEARKCFDTALDRAVSEHARAPVIAVHASLAHCLLAAQVELGDGGGGGGGGDGGGGGGTPLERAAENLRSARVAAEALGEPLLVAGAHAASACVQLRARDLDAARTHAAAALELSAAHGDRHGEAVDCVTLAIAERCAGGGRGGGVSERLGRALGLARALGYARVEASALTELSTQHLALGGARAAEHTAEQAVVVARKAGLPWCEAAALGALGAARMRTLARASPSHEPSAPSDAAADALQEASRVTARIAGAPAAARARADANHHASRLQLCARESEPAARAQLAAELKKLFGEDLARARQLGLDELERHALGNMGLATLLAGDALAAVECLETALRLGGDTEYEGRDSDLSNLGVARVALGDAAGACKHFAAAEACAAKGADASRRAAHLCRLGMAQRACAEHAPACASLLQALELLGGHAHADAAPMLSLAREVHEAGEHERAAHLLEEALLQVRDRPGGAAGSETAAPRAAAAAPGVAAGVSGE